jgi:multicomponent K+:H+ antiporter subunit A
MVIIIGVAPFLAEGIVTAAASAVTGADLHPHLKIWHGVTPALWMSIIAVAGGAILLTQHGWMDRVWAAAPRPEAKAIFDRLVDAIVRLARAITEIGHNGAISRYLAIFTATSLALGYVAYASSGLSAPTRQLLPVAPVIAVGWVMLIVATVSVVTMHHHRFRALVLIGIIGLSISAGFAYLSAPDLALTQISVETVTIMLLLLALHFMPKTTPKESPIGLKIRDGAIALGAGGGVAASPTRS